MKKDEDKVTLYGGSRTTKNDETTTTVRQPKTVTRTEETISGLQTPEAQAEFERRKRELAASRGIDPETGRVEPQYFSSILGVDPAVMKQRREDEMRLNKRKQIENGIYQGLSVLTDMATTAAGGNVYKRAADKISKEAHDNNLLLEREQQKEDAANANKIRSYEQAYAEAVQNLYDKVGKAYSRRVSNTYEQGGGTVSTKTGGGSQTSTWSQQQPRGNGSGNGRGGGSGSGIYINVKTKDGVERKYSVTKQQYDAATNLLRRHYDDILHRGAADNATPQEIKAAEDLRRDLIRVGALEQEADDMSGKVQYKLKDDMLLQNGEFFQLTPAIRNRIEEETGGQIRFVTGQQSKQQTAAAPAAQPKRRGRLTATQSNDRSATR